MILFTNQAKRIEWHETCKCKSRLDSSVCSNKQRWNEDKCRCECREELSDKKRCNEGFIWNPSNCYCECDKSCDVGEYINYGNCKCRRKIVDELVEEYSDNIDENEMIYNETVNVSLSDYNCNSCTLCIALFVEFLVTSVIISAVFVYFHWYLKESNDQFCLKNDNVI